MAAAAQHAQDLQDQAESRQPGIHEGETRQGRSRAAAADHYGKNPEPREFPTSRKRKNYENEMNGRRREKHEGKIDYKEARRK